MTNRASRQNGAMTSTGPIAATADASSWRLRRRGAPRRRYGARVDRRSTDSPALNRAGARQRLRTRLPPSGPLDPGADERGQRRRRAVDAAGRARRG